jgi:DNA-binding HxlR family transcriptional regulator
MLAEALEVLGDRWTLLVVRDLGWGPRRFTDLIGRLGGITPKTLTQRLRDLESAGIVVADRESGRREVWYRLTPKGEDLRPALDELMVWGLRHAVRPPAPGEPAHPEHLLWALRVQLERERVALGPVRWAVRVVDAGSYVLSNDGDRWTVEAGEVDKPDVTISTTKHAWARFVTTPPPLRTTDAPDLEIEGAPRSVETFLKAIEVFPFGRARGV